MGICCDINEKSVELNNFILSKNLKNEILNKFKKLFICKIKNNEKDFGNGFFGKILLPDKNNLFPTLVLFHYIEQNDIIQRKRLEILFENNKFNLELNSTRKIYRDRDLNITIIELKNYPDKKYCLEMEDDLKKDKMNKFNIQKDKYIIIYSLNVFVNEFGIIKKINKDNKDNEGFLLRINDIKVGIIINIINSKIIGIILNGKNISIKEVNQRFNNNSMSNIKNSNKIYFYIKSLIISFYLIEKVKIVFSNDINQNKDISFLISIFMKNYSEKNYSNCDKLIYDLIKRINEENQNILRNLNFEQIFNFILIKLHKELNKKQIIKKELPKDDYDENIAYNNFINNFSEQNNSEIQKIFFGLKEIIDIYKCCTLKKYSFEIYKYITFNIENINNLQNLISDLENKYIKKEKFCEMCYINSEIFSQQKLYSSPNILVIIMNNKKKMTIEYNTIIHTKKYEYKLICCITESKTENNFNIIYNLKNTWYVIKNNENNGNEVGNKIGSLILYPCVLFFEKGNIIISNITKFEKSNIINNSKINKNTGILSNKSSNNKYYVIINQKTKNNYLNKNKPYYKNNFFQQISNNNLKNINVHYKKNYIPISLKKSHSNKNLYSNYNIVNNNFINYNFANNHINTNNINNHYFNIYNQTNNKNIFYNKLNNNDSKTNSYNLKNLYIKKNNIFYKNINLNNKNLDTINIMNNNKPQTKNKIINKFINNNKNNHIFNNKNNLTMINNIVNNKNEFSIINTNTKSNNKTIDNHFINNNYNYAKIIEKEGFTKLVIDNFFSSNDNQNKNTNFSNKEYKINNQDDITLYFQFLNGKELYLDVKGKDIFSEVIKELYNKYSWLRNIQINCFLFNGIPISLNKSVNENGLKDNSQILIKEL